MFYTLTASKLTQCTNRLRGRHLYYTIPNLPQNFEYGPFSRRKGAQPGTKSGILNFEINQNEMRARSRGEAGLVTVTAVEGEPTIVAYYLTLYLKHSASADRATHHGHYTTPW